MIRNYLHFVCMQCGKPFERYLSKVNPKHPICSRECAALARTGKPKAHIPLEFTITEKGCFEVINRRIDNNGYAYTSRKMEGRQYVPLHRLVYEEMFGEIPDGLLVRHKCDNRKCVNPEHLELGTIDDNMRDRAERNRTARGEQSGRAKLTEEQAKFILIHREEDREKLAKRFNISIHTVNSIRGRKSWKHLTNA